MRRRYDIFNRAPRGLEDKTAKSLLGGDEGVKDGEAQENAPSLQGDSDKQTNRPRLQRFDAFEEMVDIFEAKIVFFCSTERFKRSMCGEINRINTPLTTSYLTMSLAQNTHIVRSTLAKPSTQARTTLRLAALKRHFLARRLLRWGFYPSPQSLVV